MIVTASQKYIRTSPQKMKFVADAVRKMSLADMRNHLVYLNKDAARRLLQTLDQAIANAQHNFGIAPEQLKLESMLVLRGPQYKRMRPRSRGQGHPILKRTTHVVIKLKSADKPVEVKAKEEVKSEVKEEVKPKTTAKKTVAKK